MATRDRVNHVTDFDWDSALAELAEVRGRMRGASDDAVAIVQGGREELERRGLC